MLFLLEERVLSSPTPTPCGRRAPGSLPGSQAGDRPVLHRVEDREVTTSPADNESYGSCRRVQPRDRPAAARGDAAGRAAAGGHRGSDLRVAAHGRPADRRAGAGGAADRGGARGRLLLLLLLRRDD